MLLQGNGDEDTLFGGSAIDLVKGGPGNDVLPPGDGRNKVYGNDRNVALRYAELGGSKGVVIDLEDDCRQESRQSRGHHAGRKVIVSGDRNELTPAEGGIAFGDAATRAPAELGALKRGEPDGTQVLTPANTAKTSSRLQDPGAGPGELVVNFGRAEAFDSEAA